MPLPKIKNRWDALLWQQRVKLFNASFTLNTISDSAAAALSTVPDGNIYFVVSESAQTKGILFIYFGKNK